jgi:hypothetical protein
MREDDRIVGRIPTPTRTFMMHRSTTVIVVAAILVAGCADEPTRPMLTRVDAQRLAATLPDDIPSLMELLFQDGNATAAQSRWSSVLRMLEEGNTTQARKLMFDIADFTLMKQRQQQLSDPDGDGEATVQTGVTKLLSLMFNMTFPDEPPLPVATVGDAVITLVDSRAQTAVTPAKKAGIELEAGSTETPFLLVIDENPESESYLARCSGPLPTTLCQFPLFYNFHPYPRTRLKKMAVFGVCTLGNHGESRHPRGPQDEAQHDRLRLAHPAHPEHNNHPVVDGVTILPLVRVSFLDCEDTTFPLPPEIGSANPFVRGAHYAMTHVGGAVMRLLTPKSLYAIDRGGGGYDDFFSPFNVVDPGVKEGGGDDIAIICCIKGR